MHNSSYDRLLVKAILEHPESYDWTLQGFGMLRIYLSEEVRMHVWDSRYRVENVSDMHTHPWHFHSMVVAGAVVNRRFEREPVSNMAHVLLEEHALRCGVGGGLTGDVKTVQLWPCPEEVVLEGNSYTQKAHEIHTSDPADGTVTIIRREFLDDTEHASVFTLHDQPWVSAEPRKATLEEVHEICQLSLEKWFS